MKKNAFIVVFGLVVGCICLVALNVFAEPRWNNQTTFMAQDDGDSIRPFTVQVGTTTPVQVYNSTTTATPKRNGYSSPDRLLVIQNLSSFNLYCGTFSAVLANSGPRFVVTSTGTSNYGAFFQTYAAPANIWCVFESAAGSGTKEVIGYVGYDSGD